MLAEKPLGTIASLIKIKGDTVGELIWTRQLSCGMDARHLIGSGWFSNYTLAVQERVRGCRR